MPSYADIVTDLEHFDKILRTHRIDVHPDSWLADALLISQELRDINRGESFQLGVDYGQRLMHLEGVHDMAGAVVLAERDGLLLPFEGHLRLFGEGKRVLAQNSPQLADDASRKLFELRLGIIAARCFDNLEVEPVDEPNSRNPDLLFDFESKRWGVACKVLDSTNPRTFIDRVVDGVRQIEKSPADTGLVAVNLKNVLNLHELFARVGTERSVVTFNSELALAAEIVGRFEQFLVSVVEELRVAGPGQVWGDGSQCAGIVFYVHAGGVALSRTGVPSHISHRLLHLVPTTGLWGHAAERLVDLMRRRLLSP